MALYLVRHGETDYNREKRFQSRTDVPLKRGGNLCGSHSGFAGRLESELREEYGARFDAWRESQYTTAPPGGGEDIISGAVRVQPALDKLLLPATQGDVLVVAHQAVNMAMKVAISGKQDVKSAATFRQKNQEVDVWDMAAGARVEQFAVKLG